MMLKCQATLSFNSICQLFSLLKVNLSTNILTFYVYIMIRDIVMRYIRTITKILILFYSMYITI